MSPIRNPARRPCAVGLLALVPVMLALAACGADSPSGPGDEPGVPDPPDGFLRFASISAGQAGACGLTAAGETWCWGAVGLSVPARYRPVLITDAPPLAAMSVGPSYSNVNGLDLLCGLTAGGEAICQPGPGTAFASVPAPLPFASLHSGTAACALTAAGEAYCWTYSLFGGVLGDGSLSNDGYVLGTPVPVAGGLTFTALGSSDSHACGIAADGRAHCWGRHNFALHLGDGDDSEFARPAPAPVAGGLQFQSLALGPMSTCGIAAGGAAYCWGLAYFGQLGNPDAPTSDCPGIGNMETGQPMPCVGTPVAVAGGHSFSAVAAGEFHSCGLAVDGKAWCWGANAWGQLGNGRSGGGATEPRPVQVAGGLRFRALAAGGRFTCGIADNDATYCWGANHAGELGGALPPGAVRTVPHPVAAP
jgi:hypothetical protein